jgi:hypothetical protein
MSVSGTMLDSDVVIAVYATGNPPEETRDGCLLFPSFRSRVCEFVHIRRCVLSVFTLRPPYTTRKIPRVPEGYSAAGRIRLSESNPLTSGNGTRYLVACIIVPQPGTMPCATNSRVHGSSPCACRSVNQGNRHLYSFGNIHM